MQLTIIYSVMLLIIILTITKAFNNFITSYCNHHNISKYTVHDSNRQDPLAIDMIR